MEIELKNGEMLNLEVTSLLLEYIEDYQGGIEQLKKDVQGQKDKNGYTKTMYAIIASNYDKPITYRQAVRLVKLEDINRIAKFVTDNIPSEMEQNFSHRI